MNETDDSEIVISANPKKIKCKDCKWASLFGELNSKCVKFSDKPYGIYYKNMSCPYFKKK